VIESRPHEPIKSGKNFALDSNIQMFAELKQPDLNERTLKDWIVEIFSELVWKGA